MIATVASQHGYALDSPGYLAAPAGSGSQSVPAGSALVSEIRAQFVVTALPDATPISTEFPGQSLAPASAVATPTGDEASPEAAGGADPGGITPIPTIRQ
jgi:hypothetical protein